MEYTITVRKVWSDTMIVEADNPVEALEKAMNWDYKNISSNGTDYTRDDASWLWYVDWEQTYTEIYDEKWKEYNFDELYDKL